MTDFEKGKMLQSILLALKPETRALLEQKCRNTGMPIEEFFGFDTSAEAGVAQVPGDPWDGRLSLTAEELARMTEKAFLLGFADPRWTFKDAIVLAIREGLKTFEDPGDP